MRGQDELDLTEVQAKASRVRLGSEVKSTWQYTSPVRSGKIISLSREQRGARWCWQSSERG